MFNDVSILVVVVIAAAIFIFGVGSTVKFFGWRKNKKDSQA